MPLPPCSTVTLLWYSVCRSVRARGRAPRGRVSALGLVLLACACVLSPAAAQGSSLTPFSLGAWSAVVAGSTAAHTCGVRAAVTGGELYCWGLNDAGQLGLGYANTTGMSVIPSSPVLTGVAAVAGGHRFTCALLSNGSMACWGLNCYGQLGRGRTSWVEYGVAHTPLPSLNAVIAISAGFGHACAVTADGMGYCWGDNSKGQLGSNATGSGPAAVGGLSGIVAIGCGTSHTCALTAGGGVHCWGGNDYGQAGQGSVSDTLSPPSSVPVLTGMAAIAVGADHSCALSQAGGVFCWGFNDDGRVGLGYANTSGCDCVPAAPATPVMIGVVQISAGGFHTCALSASGGVYCWGWNYYGQLGNGYENGGARVLAPPPAPVLTGVAAITAGLEYECAVTGAGAMSCWGHNDAGQLGFGGTEQVNTPPLPPAAPVPTRTGVVIIVAAVVGGSVGGAALLLGLTVWWRRRQQASTHCLPTATLFQSGHTKCHSPASANSCTVLVGADRQSADTVNVSPFPCVPSVLELS